MSKPYSVIFQMDPLEKINKKTDSTYLLAKEALKRNFVVFHSSPENAMIIDNKLKIFCSPLNLNNENQILIKKKNVRFEISNFDFFFIRQDPPFDMKYITNTYVLELDQKNKFKKKPLFINNPKGIRNFSEKIYPLYFNEIIPKTSITSDLSVIESFLKKHKKVVVKPLYDKGGNGIFLLDKSIGIKKKLLNKLTDNFKKPVILQEYLKKVKEGDKRVILLDGDPVGCINRVPNKGSFRANLHLGGVAKKTKLTYNEKKICEIIKPSLKKNGFFFTGIDIIDEKLTEINVTSPTGLTQINELYNTNIEEKFWDKLINKYLQN